MPALRQIDETLWEIPAEARPDMRVPARVFADAELFEAIARDGSLEQLQNVATLPGIVDAALAMPDAHQGYGFPVGGVAAMEPPDGVVSPGGVGYVDVAYALKNHLKFFSMKNRSGKYATPGLKGILAAASSDQKPDATNALSIVNPPKKFALAYPISTYTYVIVPLKTDKAAELKKFITYAIGPGQQFGPDLLFAPLPKPVLAVDKTTSAKIGT